MENTVLKNAEAVFQPTQARFMKNWEELVMVGIPWVGVILTAVLWFLAKFDIMVPFDERVEMFGAILFLDAIHIIFSFVLIASIPEIRNWSRSDLTRAQSGWMKGLKPGMRSLIIAVVLGAVIYFLKISPAVSSLRGMMTIFLLLELWGPSQHTIAQMRGISFCYNSSLRKKFPFTDAEKAQAVRCEKIERQLFHVLLWGEILYWIPGIFGADKFDFPGIKTGMHIGGTMIIMSAAGILINALYFPKQEESRKSSFLFRILLFPLKMTCGVGGLFVRAAHGTEYLFVFRRMVQGSKVSSSRRRMIYLVTALICLVYLVPFCITWPDAVSQITGWEISDSLLAYTIFGTFIIRYTHYYMDSVMFKMSDPATRAAMGPLLTTNPDEAMNSVVAATKELASHAVGAPSPEHSKGPAKNPSESVPSVG